MAHDVAAAKHLADGNAVVAVRAEDVQHAGRNAGTHRQFSGDPTGFSSTDFAAIIMFAPSFASLSAIAFPIPLLAPVMKTVFPLNNMVIFI